MSFRDILIYDEPVQTERMVPFDLLFAGATIMTNLNLTSDNQEDFRVVMLNEGGGFMDCTDADGNEFPDLISDDLISSVHARVVEIEMENVEQPENLAEYQRLD